MSDRILPKLTVLVALVAVGLLMGATELQAQEVSWEATLQQATLSVTPTGEALIEETRPLHLQPGTNRVRFSWSGVRLDPASIRFQLPRSDSYRLIDSRSSRGDHSRIWRVESSRDTQVSARIAYEPRFVRRWDEYRVTLQPDESRLEFVQQVFVSNQSGRSFESVWIGLGHGYWIPRPWPTGQTKKLFVYQVHDVPFQRIYRYQHHEGPESDESSENPLVTYQFANTGNHFLGDKPLPGGTVQVFEPSSEGSLVFAGEDQFRSREVGDTLVLEVGQSADLNVDRQETLRQRFNVRRDRAGNVELYDQRVALEYQIENFRSDTAVVHLRETIPGEWDLVESSTEYKRPSVETLILPLRLGPGRTDRVRVEYVQRHRQP